MVTGKFNKKLSQLEAIYQVVAPKTESLSALQISDFIYHIFENRDIYNISETEDDFYNKSLENKDFAVNFVFNLLKKKGHVVPNKVITEAVEIFQNGES